MYASCSTDMFSCSTDIIKRSQSKNENKFGSLISLQNKNKYARVVNWNSIVFDCILTWNGNKRLKWTVCVAKYIQAIEHTAAFVCILIQFRCRNLNWWNLVKLYFTANVIANSCAEVISCLSGSPKNTIVAYKRISLNFPKSIQISWIKFMGTHTYDTSGVQLHISIEQKHTSVWILLLLSSVE